MRLVLFDEGANKQRAAFMHSVIFGKRFSPRCFSNLNNRCFVFKSVIWGTAWLMTEHQLQRGRERDQSSLMPKLHFHAAVFATCLVILGLLKTKESSFYIVYFRVSSFLLTGRMTSKDRFGFLLLFLSGCCCNATHLSFRSFHFRCKWSKCNVSNVWLK